MHFLYLGALRLSVQYRSHCWSKLLISVSQNEFSRLCSVNCGDSSGSTIWRAPQRRPARLTATRRAVAVDKDARPATLPGRTRGYVLLILQISPINHEGRSYGRPFLCIMTVELAFDHGLMDVHMNSLEEVSCPLNAMQGPFWLLIPLLVGGIPWVQPVRGWDEQF